VHLAAGLAFPEDYFPRFKGGDAAHASKASNLIGIQAGE
jgi:hypothetical protein